MMAAMLLGLSTVLFKKSLLKNKPLEALRSKWFWAASLVALMNWVALTKELGASNISTTIPLLAQSYLVIVPLSAIWLREKVGKKELLGVALIMAGAMLL